MRDRESHGQISGPDRRAFVLAGVASAATLASVTTADAQTSKRLGPSRSNSNQQTEDGVVFRHDVNGNQRIMEGFPVPVGKRVSVENWHEHARWLHLNTDLIFKSTTAEKRNKQVWSLPRKMLSPKDFVEARVRWADLNTPRDQHEWITVKDWLDRTATDALIVLHRGHIVAEHYFGDMAPTRRHLLWSASKSVLASLMARSLPHDIFHRKAEELVQELGDTGLAGSTVRQMLDMQTAVRFPAFLPPSLMKGFTEQQRREWEFASAEMRGAKHEFACQGRAQGIFKKLPSEPADSGMYDFLLTIEKDAAREHGTYFYYAEPNVMAAQLVLESRTGKTYVAHLQDMADNLGFEHSPRITLDSIGTANGNIGLQLTLRDWARWGEWIRTGMVGETEDPNIRNFVIDIENNPRPEMWTDKSNMKLYFRNDTGYRSFFYIEQPANDSRPIVSSLGAYFQRLFIDRKNELTVAKFSSITDWKEFSGKEKIASASFVSEALPKLLGG